MKKKNLRTTFKGKWGNSILSINLKFWSCHYCGQQLQDCKPFAIVEIDEDAPHIYCSEICLTIQIKKREAQRVDPK